MRFLGNLLAAWVAAAAAISAAAVCSATAQDDVPRPNIVWITSEDNGPQLGCYGDTYATTPHIDGLAARGLVYLNCWSNAPVCAPARTAIISGMYPPSLGAEDMRSQVALPAGYLMYPQYLRQAGYYCTNNSKEDYNLEKPGQVWDESSREAHWKNRAPGQPFFAVFNITTSHESQVRTRPHKAVHDAAEVRVPAYHPDTPEVRQDWAQYYDKITEMDQQVGQRLAELEAAKLSDDTIVFYYGDHGAGMPRSKRWPYNSGLSVPLVIHVPEKFRSLAGQEYQPGGRTERLVSFVDLPATLLSLAGVQPPVQFQGHAFMGRYEQPPQEFLYGFRRRMDERYDLVRSVRDQRYVFIRNYMPHRIYGQYIQYMFQTPTTQVWKQRYDAGQLEPPQTYFWEEKPPLELYDLARDPDEIHNLADSPEHQEILRRLRDAQTRMALQIRDLGFLPEAEMHARAGESAPFALGQDADRYPLERILAAAERAAARDMASIPELLGHFEDGDSAVRYWAATGLLIRGADGVRAGRSQLHRALEDPSLSVRIAAAEALGRFGNQNDQQAALEVLLQAADVQQHGLYHSMAALNALDYMDQKAAPARSAIARLPRATEGLPRRLDAYVGNLIDKSLADLR